MHVVEMRHAEHPRQQHANDASFLMGVHGIVAPLERTPDHRAREQEVERDLGQRWPYADSMQEWRTRAANHTKPVERDVLAERISHQIDGVAEIGESADPVEFAERRSSWFEERLRRNHQNVHAVGPRNCTDRPAAGQCKLLMVNGMRLAAWVRPGASACYTVEFCQVAPDSQYSLEH